MDTVAAIVAVVCAPKEGGIEIHPIIINIYTHVNLCASYQWFSHAYLCKRSPDYTYIKYYIDFMLRITSEQASVKLREIPSESKRPEGVYFQNNHWLGKQYFHHVCRCVQCGFTFRYWAFARSKTMVTGGGRKARRGREGGECVCGAMSWMSRCMCKYVYQCTFLKTNNSTVLTTT